MVNLGDSTLMKLDAADSTIRGTYPMPFSSPPFVFYDDDACRLCFDGAHIWANNRRLGTVSKL